MEASPTDVKNVVLVQRFRRRIRLGRCLQGAAQNGCVSIVQNPTTSWPTTSPSPAHDRRAGRPSDLVGHSYGGVVITETGNDPQGRRPGLHHAFAPTRQVHRT
jgi:hypothetical protein